MLGRCLGLLLPFVRVPEADTYGRPRAKKQRKEAREEGKGGSLDIGTTTMRRDGGFRPAHSRPGWLSCPQCYLANLDRFCPLSCMSCKLFATLHATSGREETGGAGTGVPCAARRDLGYESVCTLLLSPPLVSRYVVPIRFLELQPPGRAWHAPLPDALCHGCLLFFLLFFLLSSASSQSASFAVPPWFVHSLPPRAWHAFVMCTHLLRVGHTTCPRADPFVVVFSVHQASRACTTDRQARSAMLSDASLSKPPLRFSSSIPDRVGSG